MRRITALLVIIIFALATLTGCGKADQETLTVYAAASLNKSFTQIAKDFEKEHPDVLVKFSFGGSSDLVEQIKAGADADVFASADTKNMDLLGDEAIKPQIFATNTLEIAVPPGNPASISKFAELTKPGVKLVICAAEVPCGSATQTAAASAGLKLKPVSEEQSVTDVLGKVAAGEADAGLVYVTDVLGAGGSVTGVPFAESASAVNSYPIARLDDADDDDLADEFVDFVLSAQGQAVLEKAGFGSPSPTQ